MNKVILVPHWVQETLRRNQMNLNECLDFSKIRSILSTNDLAGFLALQEFAGYLYGDEENFTRYPDLLAEWSEGASGENLNYLQITLPALANDASIVNEVKARLFSPESKDSRYEEAFITYDLKPSTVGVVVYPGHFVTGSKQKLELPLIESILKVFYVYTPYHIVAGTDFFKKYLHLLSSKSVIV